jgi:FkbM family methyltransferase
MASLEKRMLRRVQSWAGPGWACRISNADQWIKRRRVRFSYDQTLQLYYADEDDIRQYFAEKMRGLALYARGVKKRSDDLVRSYLLNRVEFSRGDVVFDCGANYADLYVHLRTMLNPHDYITFEPGIEEFRCVERNALGCRNFNLGLSNVTGRQTLYVSSAGADSSIIEPKSYTSTMEIETMTLDAFAERHELRQVKVLKLEAEGFEPEILEGAEHFLTICEYVAIDGGPERGINEEETFSFQQDFLFGRGFEMVERNPRHRRALFRNRNLAVPPST